MSRARAARSFTVAHVVLTNGCSATSTPSAFFAALAALFEPASPPSASNFAFAAAACSSFSFFKRCFSANAAAFSAAAATEIDRTRMRRVCNRQSPLSRTNAEMIQR
jgi:hypothetical protein